MVFWALTKCVLDIKHQSRKRMKLQKYNDRNTNELRRFKLHIVFFFLPFQRNFHAFSLWPHPPVTARIKCLMVNKPACALLTHAAVAPSTGNKSEHVACKFANTRPWRPDRGMGRGNRGRMHIIWSQWVGCACWYSGDDGRTCMRQTRSVRRGKGQVMTSCCEWSVYCYKLRILTRNDKVRHCLRQGIIFLFLANVKGHR